MLSFLFPKEYVKSIFEINYTALSLKKIKGLIFDIDNTLVPFDVERPTEKIIEHFKNLTEMGFKLCLVSNNKEQRVKLFSEPLALTAVHKARKPRRGGIKKALSMLGTSPEETAIIGDQIFTDVFSGNRTGLYTILVEPVSLKDELTVKIKRAPERVIVNMYKRRNIKNV